jgi:hypothetical protein
VKPIAKRPFRIDCAETDCGVKQVLVTDFDGTATSELSPGKYVLSCVAPVEFEGKTFTWKMPFEVKSGQTSRIELSNDNAEIAQAGTAATLPLPTEGEIFRKVRPSVFKIDSEFASGSGFLVDEAGLILTNRHVIHDSDYLAVKVDEQRKYQAVLVADDPKNDLAVLRINDAVARGLTPLPLASAASAPVVGERVLAVGSPLATEAILTSGIVSKVEESAIYSDVSINPGNSGGPLFNLKGEVLGINTFGLSASQTGGPGVAGIVRIHVAQPLIDKVRGSLGTLALPSDRQLPEASSYRFPPDKLKDLVLHSDYEPRQYHLEAGKIDVQFVTPVVLAQLEVQAAKEASEGRNKRHKHGHTKEYSAGEDFYEWRRYTGDYRAVVRIQAVPEIKPTSGSIFAMMLIGVAPRFKFKTDFDRMELWRGDTVIEPIHPGRAPSDLHASIKDVSYYGVYEYPPEAFKPGEKLTLKVWEQGKPEAKPREITPALQAKIWTDFQAFFEAVEKNDAETLPEEPKPGS